MHRTLAAGVAAAVALGIGAGGYATASAADTSAPGFATIRTTAGFTGQAIVSPATGRLVVAGVDATGHVIVQDQVHGQVVSTQQLEATASFVRLAAYGGQVWVLATGPKPSLWHSAGAGYTSVGLPAAPTSTDANDPLYNASLAPTGLAVDGTRVALWSTLTYQQDPTQSYQTTEAVHQVMTAGAWGPLQRPHKYATAHYPSNTSVGDPDMLIDGRVVGARTMPSMRSIDTTLYDYSVSPAGFVAPVWTWSGYSSHTKTDRVVARSLTDLTLWGEDYVADFVSTPTTKGACIHVVNGVSTRCPAPAWVVRAVAALADGRQVVGGRDTPTTSTTTAEGGYAIAGADGSLTPLAGDPGKATVQLVVEPGTSRVWSLVTDGTTTSLQRADLGPDTPTPSPTATPTPTPTATPKPKPTKPKKPKQPKQPKKPTSPKKPWYPPYGA